MASKWEMIKKVQPETWARTICLLIAFANQILAVFGKGEIPFTENDVYQAVSIVATIGTGFIAWWKNNSFTKAAIEADKVMKEKKSLK